MPDMDAAGGGHGVQRRCRGVVPGGGLAQHPGLRHLPPPPARRGEPTGGGGVGGCKPGALPRAVPLPAGPEAGRGAGGGGAAKPGSFFLIVGEG